MVWALRVACASGSSSLEDVHVPSKAVRKEGDRARFRND